MPRTRRAKLLTACATALVLVVTVVVVAYLEGSESGSAAREGPQRPTTVITGLVGPLDAMTFGRDGGTLITVGRDDHTVRRWDTATGQSKGAFTVKGPTGTLAFSADGGTLAAAGVSPDSKCTVRLWDLDLWDLDAGQRAVTLTADEVQGGCQVAVGPGGKVVATAGTLATAKDDYDNRVRLWKVATRRATANLPGHTNGVGTLEFSADGTLLASSGYAGDTTRLWDVAKGRRRIALPADPGNIVTMSAFDPDGKVLATIRGSDPGNRVQLWDVTTGKVSASLAKTGETFTAVVFGPDGRALAAGTSPGAGAGGVLVRDVSTGEVAHVFTGHTSPVLLASSPDGKTLAAAGGDGTVRLWSLR